jgi:hypothetical protein
MTVLMSSTLIAWPERRDQQACIDCWNETLVFVSAVPAGSTQGPV